MAAALIRPLLLGCLAAMGSGADAQQLKTFVQTGSGADRIALGFPVPVPQDTPLPFDGFRSYAGLHTRAQDLLLISPRLSGAVSGQTHEGRDIWVYRVGDADRVGAEGRPEPAVMINGGIHAREWQSPEVVTGLLESLVESVDPVGMDRFLLDEVNLVVVPVLNIDGFLMTQSEPARIYEGQDTTDPTWPRDGRMRRKNHRNTDGIFSTSADHRGGVDLNRNNLPYWATSTQSTSLEASLIHHGPSPASEPEIQALQQAALQGPSNELRVYIDAHSHSQVLFTIRTENGRRNSIMAALASDFASHHRAISISAASPNGRLYLDRPDQAGFGIGQTAEYFGNLLQIPSWTLEIEPGVNGAVEYGSFGYHHDGFILPESQIRRVREQLSESHRVVLYHAAGPASVAQLEVRSVDQTLLQRSRWQAVSPQRRQLQNEGNGGLRPGQRHQLWLAFDRPMRQRIGGVAQVLPGQQTGRLMPTLNLLSGERSLAIDMTQARWLGSPDADGRSFYRYREDALVVDFELPADFPTGSATLEVDAYDLIGRRLDTQPATPVGWADGHWTGYESASGTESDFGGIDRNLSLWVDAGEQIILKQQPPALSEGGSIALEFERQGSGQGAATLDLGLDSDRSVQLSQTQLQWGDGDTGAQSLLISLPDNLLVDDEGELLLSLQSSLPLAVEQVRIRLLDNDSPSLRRGIVGEAASETDPSIRAQRLGELLVGAANLGTAVELQLASGEVRFADTSPGAPLHESLVPIAGDVRIRGAQTIVALGQRRLASVANGASLSLEGLVLSSGHGGADAVLINDGTLKLSDCQFRAFGSTAIRNAGALLLQRCGSVDLGQPLVQQNAGSSNLANVTLAGSAPTLWQQTGGEAEWTHVSLSSSAAEPVEVAAGALLQLRDSLLSLDGPGSSDPCSGFYTSLGGNVLGGPACTAGNGVDLRLSQAVVASVDGDHATLLPIEQVASDMRSCPQRDQLGVARGASCLPGARDAGVAFPRGLWWDPQRPGHGQHITIVQNILFMLWYTYDAEGLPVTWTAQGPLVDGRVTAALLQWRREAVTELPRAQQIGGIELRVVDGTTIHLGWGLNDGSGSGFEVLEPFRFAPQAGQSLRTGLYADNQDLGWGMTLQEEGNIAFALLYYFAADDRLRWASAQGGGGIDQRLLAQAQTGVCLFCSDAAVNAQPSGEWRLQSLGPDQLRFTGQLSTAVTPGGSWIRQTVLERFDPLD
ncbi:MAG: M14 family zinc carboxypeptidase [Lysobacterales bacterium]